MKRCGQVINEALHKIFEADSDVYLLGEDILDPYGGAFKITKGLSTRFPERVLATPISESATVGIAAGMALRRLKPIVEIMFGDFITLACDQIINHLSKFPAMYNRQVKCPLVIRTPMGGRRGYGPTHSQSLEKLFFGVPNILVVAPSHIHDIDKILSYAVLKEDTPLIFIENKRMYGLPAISDANNKHLEEFAFSETEKPYPTITLSLNNFDSCDLTLVTYGDMASFCCEAAIKALLEYEIYSEIVIPSSLSPIDEEPIINSIERSGKLLTVEEGTISCGFGSEVVSRMSSQAWNILQAPPSRVAAPNTVIPCSKQLEDAVLPQTEGIFEAITGLMKLGRLNSDRSHSSYNRF